MYVFCMHDFRKPLIKKMFYNELAVVDKEIFSLHIIMYALPPLDNYVLIIPES